MNRENIFKKVSQYRSTHLRRPSSFFIFVYLLCCHGNSLRCSLLAWLPKVEAGEGVERVGVTSEWSAWV